MNESKKAICFEDIPFFQKKRKIKPEGLKFLAFLDIATNTEECFDQLGDFLVYGFFLC